MSDVEFIRGLEDGIYVPNAHIWFICMRDQLKNLYKRTVFSFVLAVSAISGGAIANGFDDLASCKGLSLRDCKESVIKSDNIDHPLLHADINRLLMGLPVSYGFLLNTADVTPPNTEYTHIGWVPNVVRSNINSSALGSESTSTTLDYTLDARVPIDVARLNLSVEASGVSSSRAAYTSAMSGPLFVSILALIGIVAVSRRNVS